MNDMNADETDIPGVTDDPVIQLLLSGQAATLDEAEEMYLDASLPEVYELLRRPATDQDLMEHPLFRLLIIRGSRGWEDSLL
jgi:hypothetical protein